MEINKEPWVEGLENNADLILITLLTITDVTITTQAVLFAMNQPVVNLEVYHMNPKLIYINTEILGPILIFKSLLLYMCCVTLTQRLNEKFNDT